jgi:hypothetical protein
MAESLQKWIRKCSELTDSNLKEYLNTIHGNSANSFLQAIEKASSTTKKHTNLDDFSHIIKELDSAGKDVFQNLEREGFPPSFVHIKDRQRLIQRIKEHQSALAHPISNFKSLLFRKYIGQDLLDIYDTFDQKMEFYLYCDQKFGWEKAMFRFYSNYYHFLEDYPMFLYSGVCWTKLRNRNVEWRQWLESSTSKELSPENKASNLFWKKYSRELVLFGI